MSARSGPPGSAPPGVVALVGPAAAYVVYVFVVGTLPHVGPPMGMSDKLAHAAVFGVMVPLLSRAARYLDVRGGRASAWARGSLPAASVARRVGMSAGVATLLGGALEAWQAFLPTRRAEWLDLAADAAGAGACALALVLWARVTAPGARG